MLTDDQIPRPRTILEALEMHAAEGPDRAAITSTLNGERKELTFATLVDRGRGLDSFITYVDEVTGGLDADTVSRIVRVVETTFSFEYTIEELATRDLSVSIRIVRAAGDDYSFIDSVADRAPVNVTYVSAEADHYSILREDVDELVLLIDAHRLLDPEDVPYEAGAGGS